MSVLVYIENWEGKFKKLSYELISYAAGIARQLQTEVTAVSIGNVADDELKKAGSYGASKILKIEGSNYNYLDNRLYAAAIAGAAEKENAEVIIFAANNSGKAIAPRVAVRLKAGMVSGVIALPASTSPFIIRKKVFTGKTFSEVEVKSQVKVLTLMQNAYGVENGNTETQIEAFNPAVDQMASGIKVVEINKQTGKILLTDAEIVVSGGRGMKGPEYWKPIEELAELLGGATACSRPVSDEGWRPHHEHVGQTGKIIAPSLYFAFGISGAIQHLGGVSSSKVIVAVNKDKDAPIFESANYGIVGDVQAVIPEIIKAVREIKGQ